MTATKSTGECMQLGAVRRPVIAVLGLARDCSGTLNLHFEELMKLTEIGFDWYVIIGENASRDSTRNILESASIELPLEIVATDEMAQHSDRLRRMAVGRQLLHEKLQRKSKPPDYVVVIDFDLSGRGVCQAIGQGVEFLSENPDYFAVGATSRPRYYDLLAFESPQLSFEWLGATDFTAQSKIDTLKMHARRIKPAQEALTDYDSTIPCVSTFNGLCIYRYQAFALGTYLDSAETPRCEHITFNRQVGELSRLKIAIHPRVVVDAPSQYVYDSFLGYLVKAGVRKLQSRLGRGR